MIINFIGNFANSYVGESADEIHLARELEDLGHQVNKVPRDQWKAMVDGEEIKDDWVLPCKKADINIICKWHHFNDEKYIKTLKSYTFKNSPVFYWVWDYMDDNGFPDWHMTMAKAADLYLSGEMGLAPHYRNSGVKFYYFQMDVCDKDLSTFISADKQYDVIFTGSYLGQGDRIPFLKAINDQIPVTIFSWNYEEWVKAGFTAYPAKYGSAYNELISKSNIVLGLSVEGHCYGYWSNRVGKVLHAGGFLLQQYTPGMEQFLPTDGVDYFSTPEEAVEKIREKLKKPMVFGTDPFDAYKFTSRDKMERLVILMERFLKEDNGRKWILP